jgi:hypothetical protein
MHLLLFGQLWVPNFDCLIILIIGILIYDVEVLLELFLTSHEQRIFVIFIKVEGHLKILDLGNIYRGKYLP